MKRHINLKKTAAILIAALMILALAGCADSGDQNRQTARIGDEVITQGQLDNFTMLTLYRQGYDLSGTTKALKEECLQDMIDAEALSQYCQDNGIDLYDDTYNSGKSAFMDSIKKNDADFLDQNGIKDSDLITYYRSQYLSSKLLERVQSEYSADQIAREAQAYYDKHKDEYKVESEKRISEILTHKKKIAEEAVSRLDSGEQFADVARDLSEDINSAANGGDMGFFTKSEIKDEFGSEVFKMAVGQYSQPIKTTDGYAVVMVTASNDSGYKSFDEVSQEISYSLYKKYGDAKVKEIEKDMGIEKDEVK